MSDEIVTIAAFANPFEANLAKQCLEEAGIPAFLADEQTIGVAWHLSIALGGIRLQVRSADASQSMAILEKQADTGSLSSETAHPSPLDEPSHSEFVTASPQVAMTGREQDAERAHRAAVVGLVFLPLQPYVSWLLLKILFSSERLRPKSRRSVWIASAINLVFILGVISLFNRIASG
jgi:putative signal transducing protein